MCKFQKIVDTHKCGPKKYNIQSSNNGRFFFKSFESFFPHFVESYPKFTAETCTSLIFRPRRDIDMNIYLDFDCKSREPIQFETKDLARFATIVGTVLGSPEFVLTKRVASYLKTTKTEQFHAFGFHLWFLGKFSLTQCQLVRDTILSQKLLDPLRKKYNFYNDDEDVVDKRPALRSNGLYFVGDRKKVAPSHYICHAKGKKRLFGWQFSEQKLYCTLMEQLYSFIWEPRGTVQKLAPSSKPVRKLTTVKSGFNLPLFLEITKGHVANHVEWQQLCVFFRSQGLDCRETNDLLEKAWAPFRKTCNTPRRKNATYNFMRKIQHFDVTKASVVRYLQNWAVRKYTDKELFGGAVKLLYNEYKHFTRDRTQMFKYSTLVDFLKRTVEYVFTIKKFTWCYQTSVKDRNGNVVLLTHRMMSKNPPFSGNDDIAIKTYPPVANLVKFLEKQKPKKVNSEETVRLKKKIEALIPEVQELDDKQAYEKAKELGMDAPPKVVLFSAVIHQLQLDTELNRFTEITFQPTPAHKKPESSNPVILNTFNGFTLNQYSPHKIIDVEETQLWVYFREVFGYGSTSHVQFRYILNLVAWHLQFPHRRTGRIILLISKAEGTGKSFLFNIMSMLLDGYTSFHDSLTTYLQRFNISDHSKLVIWVDDIFGASVKETRRMFPKVTCSTQQYEKKGETMIKLTEYSNIWVTSNEKTPLHIKPTDRRQLIFRVSERKLRDRAFFERCSEECKDLDIAHAWFTFLKKRDLSSFNPSGDPDRALKGETIASCMVKSHVFMRLFFLEEWFRTYNRELVPAIWLQHYEVTRNVNSPHKGEIRLRVSQKRLYKLYLSFVKEFYPQSRARNSDTFWDELTELGLIRFPKRRHIRTLSGHNRKFFVIDLYFETFKNRMKVLYPGITLTTWLHIENLEGFQALMKQYNGAQFVP